MASDEFVPAAVARRLVGKTYSVDKNLTARKRDLVARDRFELPTRGFSVLEALFSAGEINNLPTTI